MRSTTQRAHPAVPVFIYGYDHSGKPFKEFTKTVTISANGGFVEIVAAVAREHPLLVMNLATGHSISCRVASIQSASNGNAKAHVGIRFSSPSPQFWRLEFPTEEDMDHDIGKRIELLEAWNP